METLSETEARIKAGLDKARLEQKLTHAAIAGRLGIKPPSVTNILTRKRGVIPQSLLDVADALGLEIVIQPKQKG